MESNNAIRTHDYWSDERITLVRGCYIGQFIAIEELMIHIFWWALGTPTTENHGLGSFGLIKSQLIDPLGITKKIDLIAAIVASEDLSAEFPTLVPSLRECCKYRNYFAHWSINIHDGPDGERWVFSATGVTRGQHATRRTRKEVDGWFERLATTQNEFEHFYGEMYDRYGELGRGDIERRRSARR